MRIASSCELRFGCFGGSCTTRCKKQLLIPDVITFCIGDFKGLPVFYLCVYLIDIKDENLYVSTFTKHNPLHLFSTKRHIISTNSTTRLERTTNGIDILSFAAFWCWNIFHFDVCKPQVCFCCYFTVSWPFCTRI